MGALLPPLVELIEPFTGGELVEERDPFARALLLGLMLRADESLRAKTPGAVLDAGLGTPFDAGGVIGFADAPLLKTEPGRVPNLGNSN
jgi:hypothetical protein